jgi:hypothetical protein
MITLTVKTPVSDSLIFSDKVVINYEVKDTEGVFNKVVFDLNGAIVEQTSRTGLFEMELQEGSHTLVAYVKNKFGKEIISTRNTINFSTKPITIELKNKLSSVVSSSIPDFLEQDYSVFVDFIKYYYTWLESTKDPNLIPHSIEQFLDVDTVPPQLIDRFYETYLTSFPREFSKDKETGAVLDITKVIKRIKQFYSRKGTEDSFRFLFRLMFDTEITLTYPREKILRASQAEWVEQKFIRVKSANTTEQQLLSLQGEEIYHIDASGNKTFSATIDDVLFTSYNNTEVASLYLSNIAGSLEDSYVFYDTIIDGVSETIKINLYNMIVKSEINGCLNFDHSVGEKIKIQHDGGRTHRCLNCQFFKIGNVSVLAPTGYGYLALVKEINEYGSITEIKIIDPGVNYDENVNSKFMTFIDGVNRSCIITHTLGYLFTEEGKYKSKKSLLSDISILQDNFYYQQNSYEIGAPITPYKYSDILQQNVHPAGYKAFYKYDIIDKLIEPKSITRDESFGSTTTNPNPESQNSFKSSLSEIQSRRLNSNILNINTSGLTNQSTDIATDIATDN